ncbi:hypothetical protein ABTZ99_21645 [Actinosynnema sp. NPDC002837]
MNGGELLHLAVAGVPGVVVITYAAFRLVDHLVFLLGLWLVLRSTRDVDRVKAITAYKQTARRR